MKMKIDGRLFIVFIMVVALIAGANGKSVSVGRGSSIAVGGGSSAAGILASDGMVTHSSISSTGVIGNLNIDPWVQDTNGDYAEVGVTGTNIAGFSYNDNYYPGKGSGWVSNAVAAQQWLSASSADSLNAYAYASNSAGDTAGADLNLNSGSLKDYYSGAYAGTASWLGIDSGAFAQQTLNNANGKAIQAQTWAVDPAGDAAGALTSVEDGALNGYSVQSASAQYSNGLSAAGVSVDSMSASAPSGSINNVVDTYDNTGDLSLCGTSIDKGDLSGSTMAYSIKDMGATTSSVINTATGSLIDLTSHAQNTRLASEYVSSSTGSTTSIPTYYGGADFEYKSGSLATAKLQSIATSSNVVITPTLPTSVKTAIMLEPMNYAFTKYGGATDLGSTVFPDLVGKGYATLRYTDSGASSDKFENLGKDNVVLVDSHMNSDVIGLSTIDPSTGLNYIPASQLNYEASAKSLVILAGCDSFGGYPQKSALANAVSNAGLSGGYANTIETHWDHDYLSYFFGALGNGNTASSANSNAYTLATYKYGSSPYYLPLVFFGDQNFKL